MASYHKKRTFFSLSFSTASICSEKPTKPLKSFEKGGVGLGILASMINDSRKEQEPNSLTPSKHPFSIVSAPKPAANFKGCVGFISSFDGTDESDEESYTCVISHVGDDLIKKRVYYGGSGDVLMTDFDPNCGAGGGLFDSNVGVCFGGDGEGKRDCLKMDFLNSCYLCNKLLHGLDIFMYRGDKAFCSAECREKQIRSEEFWETCGSDARKLHDCSLSPCSSPQVLIAGVAAA